MNLFRWARGEQERKNCNHFRTAAASEEGRNHQRRGEVESTAPRGRMAEATGKA